MKKYGIISLVIGGRRINMSEKNNEEMNASGWDAITEVFDKLYPNAEEMHYAPDVYWELGGNEPLNGISVYDAGDYYHFITYGLSELYEKESDNKEYSGYGMEFTFKLKKDGLVDEKKEIINIYNYLQAIARITFTNGTLFEQYQSLSLGKNEGIDVNKKSQITDFIMVPDSKCEGIDTPNGRVNFVCFVGVTKNEINAKTNKEMTVKELYDRIGTDITDYSRESTI